MIKKIIFFAAIAGLLAGTRAWMDYRHKKDIGYCFVENRRLTDNEIVDAAVTELLKNLEKEYQSLSPDEQAKRVRYEGLDDFYSRQPRCCGFSGAFGKSIYPEKPGRVLVKDSFIKDISYQYRIDGDKKFKRARAIISYCADNVAIADTGLGYETSISPNRSDIKSNIRNNR